MHTSDKNVVRRRKVFYIPGYDPNPPRRYRELYRSEGSDQADISGYELNVRGKPKSKIFGWTVTSDIYGDRVSADIDVLIWSDIVKSSMAAGVVGTYVQMARTVWIYLATGAFRRMMWLRKGPVLAALYPIVMLLVQLFIAFLFFKGTADILSTISRRAVEFFTGPIQPGLIPTLGGWISVIVGLVAAYAILEWFRKNDRHFYAYYLMHDYAFSAQHYGKTPAKLEKRMQAFQRLIARALDSDVDEVLVVGHSSGAHLATSILANLDRSQDIKPNGAVLSFLSLGQVIPMVSFLPKANQLRADLHDLSQSGSLTWIDVSAPGDGCSFALCDPVAVTGVAPATGKKWPLVLSAAFSQTLSEARWKSLKHKFFRLHFQYLCAFDKPGDYDYFQITAGPLTLQERFAHREPSKNRIDVAASGHTSMRV